MIAFIDSGGAPPRLEAGSNRSPSRFKSISSETMSSALSQKQRDEMIDPSSLSLDQLQYMKQNLDQVRAAVDRLSHRY